MNGIPASNLSPTPARTAFGAGVAAAANMSSVHPENVTLVAVIDGATAQVTASSTPVISGGFVLSAGLSASQINGNATLRTELAGAVASVANVDPSSVQALQASNVSGGSSRRVLSVGTLVKYDILLLAGEVGTDTKIAQIQANMTSAVQGTGLIDALRAQPVLAGVSSQLALDQARSVALVSSAPFTSKRTSAEKRGARLARGLCTQY
jgi:hypothetical protein